MPILTYYSFRIGNLMAQTLFIKEYLYNENWCGYPDGLVEGTLEGSTASEIPLDEG